MSIGYLAGYVVFWRGGSWCWIFLIGESAAVLYAAAAGKAFAAGLKVSSFFRKTIRNVSELTSSYLISYVLIYMDRFLVLFLLREELVSVYYIATTYGKCVALVIPPVTSVLLSNISKGVIVLNKKTVNRVVAGSLAAVAFFFLIGLPVSRGIVFWRYPQEYAACLPVMDIGNLAQIVYYSCSIVNMMAIRLCEMRLQVKVEVTYAICFILFAVIGARLSGLLGLAYGSLAANCLRFLMLTIPVYRQIKYKG
jgi:O-antigen/teichoic acid export membrane protein